MAQWFPEGQGKDVGGVDALALVIQVLLIASDGAVVPSPLTYEVQLRTRTRSPSGSFIGAEIEQYELSRKHMLVAPETGGLTRLDERAPVYLPAAGNDFSFATPPALDRAPVLVPLRDRCASCHGEALGTIATFAMHATPGSAPRVERLDPGENRHARDVAERKMTREEFLSLQRRWYR
jgi:hypothetical protein